MPYKDEEKQREYVRNWVAERKAKWFAENGPCKNCGSEDTLELHHKDPKQKESHRIWSWKEERRLVELAKCIVLCSECHDLAHTKVGPEGTVWCSSCKQFLPIESFGKQNHKGERRKYRWECNQCRKAHGWR